MSVSTHAYLDLDLRAAVGFAQRHENQAALMHHVRDVFVDTPYPEVTPEKLKIAKTPSTLFANYGRPVPVLRALSELLLSARDARLVTNQITAGLGITPGRSATSQADIQRGRGMLHLARARVLAEQDDYVGAAKPAQDAAAAFAQAIAADPTAVHRSLLGDALVEQVLLGRGGTRWWTALRTNPISGTTEEMASRLSEAHELYASAGNLYGLVHVELRLASLTPTGVIDPVRFDDPFLLGIHRVDGRAVRYERPLPPELALLRARLLADDDAGRRRLLVHLDRLADEAGDPLVSARARARAASTRLKLLDAGGPGTLREAIGPLLDHPDDRWTTRAEETAEPIGLAVAYARRDPTHDGPLAGKLSRLAKSDLLRLRSLAVTMTSRHKSWVQAFAHAAVAGIDASAPKAAHHSAAAAATSADLHAAAARARFQRMRDQQVDFDEGDEAVEASAGSASSPAATPAERIAPLDRALEQAIAAAAMLADDFNSSDLSQLRDRIDVLQDRLFTTGWDGS